MTERNLHASLVDLGRRLDALDARLAAELDRLRRGESERLPTSITATGVTEHKHTHNSDHRGHPILRKLSKGTPTIDLVRISRNVSEEQ